MKVHQWWAEGKDYPLQDSGNPLSKGTQNAFTLLCCKGTLRTYNHLPVHHDTCTLLGKAALIWDYSSPRKEYFPLLNFMRSLCTQFSILVRSLWMTVQLCSVLSMCTRCPGWRILVTVLTTGVTPLVTGLQTNIMQLFIPLWAHSLIFQFTLLLTYPTHALSYC